ncbi:zinc-dependent alcohol dehydrogenase [Halorussus halophilus]|uniref:zinc-dependent alcohol dehydrogenase n=1 Tax=Halorussus halophilus TaxID=2650975 RepID=UPI0013013F37|nr:zinc-binding alcohol dehydrogenase [Halorussus halophilus]
MGQSLYFTGPRDVAVRQRECPDPEAGEVRVRTEYSAVSPGTELLVYRGDAPTEMTTDETLDTLSGSFEFPLQYGYAVVGRVTETGPDVDSEWVGQRVFAFNPHESHFCAPVSDLLAVPEDCSSEAAAFLPTVETAVNFLHDGAPLLGERVAVFGQGLVGLLTTGLLANYPLDSLVTLDCYESRRARSAELGADATLDPRKGECASAGEDACASERIREQFGDEGTDLTYELSGQPGALDSAIAATGYDGRVVIGSWYGTKPVELDLGGRFHRSRVRVESSQVSTIDPELRGRWSKDRRLDVAWDELADLSPERFVTHEFDIEEAERAYRLLDEHPEDALGVLFRYES